MTLFAKLIHVFSPVLSGVTRSSVSESLVLTPEEVEEAGTLLEIDPTRLDRRTFLRLVGQGGVGSVVTSQVQTPQGVLRLFDMGGSQRRRNVLQLQEEFRYNARRVIGLFQGFADPIAPPHIVALGSNLIEQYKRESDILLRKIEKDTAIGSVMSPEERSNLVDRYFDHLMDKRYLPATSLIADPFSLEGDFSEDSGNPRLEQPGVEKESPDPCNTIAWIGFCGTRTFLHGDSGNLFEDWLEDYDFILPWGF